MRSLWNPPLSSQLGKCAEFSKSIHFFVGAARLKKYRSATSTGAIGSVAQSPVPIGPDHKRRRPHRTDSLLTKPTFLPGK